MLHQMKHKIKYTIIFFNNKKLFVVITTLFFLFISIIELESQIIDTNNYIDSSQIIQQTDTLTLDSLNQNSEELSFYEGYIEPIIVVVLAAVVTILLFSVRSNK